MLSHLLAGRRKVFRGRYDVIALTHRTWPCNDSRRDCMRHKVGITLYVSSVGPTCSSHTTSKIWAQRLIAARLVSARLTAKTLLMKSRSPTRQRNRAAKLVLPGPCCRAVFRHERLPVCLTVYSQPGSSFLRALAKDINAQAFALTLPGYLSDTVFH